MLLRIICRFAALLLTASVFAVEPLPLERDAASRAEPREVATAHPLAVLTNAVTVRALTSKEAAQHWPVRLCGVVLLQQGDNKITICDDTGGIYMEADDPFHEEYQRGELITV